MMYWHALACSVRLWHVLSLASSFRLWHALSGYGMRWHALACAGMRWHVLALNPYCSEQREMKNRAVCFFLYCFFSKLLTLEFVQYI